MVVNKVSKIKGSKLLLYGYILLTVPIKPIKHLKCSVLSKLGLNTILATFISYVFGAYK